MNHSKNLANLETGGDIRPYRAGDEEKIIRLLETVFKGWPSFDLVCSPLEYWRWRYKGHSSQIVVYQSVDEIVGCIHYTSMHMKIGDKTYRCCLAGDIAILKAFRSRGITGAMSKLAIQLRIEAGIWFTYFETRNPRLVHSFKKTTYRLPLQSRHLVRVEDINRHLQRQKHEKQWLKSWIFRFLKVVNQLIPSRLSIDRNSRLNLSNVTTFDDRFDEFWNRLAKGYGLIIQRDRRYLNWRYCDSRGGNYQVKIAEDANEVLGYIVLRIDTKDEEYPVAYIVDLLCIADRIDAAQALIKDSLAYFDQQHVPAVRCLVPNKHPYRKLLARHGFIDTLERNIVFLRANMPMKKEFALMKSIAPGQFYYSYGDIDTI